MAEVSGLNSLSRRAGEWGKRDQSAATAHAPMRRRTCTRGLRQPGHEMERRA